MKISDETNSKAHCTKALGLKNNCLAKLAQKGSVYLPFCTKIREWAQSRQILFLRQSLFRVIKHRQICLPFRGHQLHFLKCLGRFIKYVSVYCVICSSQNKTIFCHLINWQCIFLVDNVRVPCVAQTLMQYFIGFEALKVVKLITAILIGSPSTLSPLLLVRLAPLHDVLNWNTSRTPNLQTVKEKKWKALGKVRKTCTFIFNDLLGSSNVRRCQSDYWELAWNSECFTAHTCGRLHR